MSSASDPSHHSQLPQVKLQAERNLRARAPKPTGQQAEEWKSAGARWNRAKRSEDSYRALTEPLGLPDVPPTTPYYNQRATSAPVFSPEFLQAPRLHRVLNDEEKIVWDKYLHFEAVKGTNDLC